MKLLSAVAPVAALLLAGFPEPAHTASTPPLTPEEARVIAAEAYVYLYPMILMDVTKQVMTNLPANQRPGVAPVNQFAHARSFPPANFRDVVRPNFDTLYSTAWVDASTEPLILQVPDTNGRHYLLPMLDMWSNVFAVPGKRATGTQAANYILLPPNHRGAIPENLQPIHLPTPVIWIVGRTQTNGPDDYPAVHKIQDSLALVPLSSWGKPYTPPPFVPDSSVNMTQDPMTQVDNMDAKTFFAHGMKLLSTMPPQPTDWSQIQRMKRIGLEPGKNPDWSHLSAEAQKAVSTIAPVAMEHLKKSIPSVGKLANGWQINTDTVGVYGNSYLKRAVLALVGLGANPPEEAIYPLLQADSQGNPVVAEKSYILHFTKDQLPPVEAFWSVTMYDEVGFQVANELNRFAIGDRDKLTYNDDGSLTLYVQHKNPGPAKQGNWLPAPPSGKLGITMRLYAPKAEALDGRWVPPALKPVPADGKARKDNPKSR